MAKARQPKPSTGAAPPKADWERDQFSARFTARRFARLREIAADMPQGATPVQAVDRAVELALAAKRSRSDEVPTFDMLEERLGRLEAARIDDAQAARQTADETLRQVRELAGLISAVAAATPDSEGADFGRERDSGDAAMPLRAWLDAFAPTARSVAALAGWRSKLKLTPRHVAMNFEIGVAGSTSPRSIVRVEPLDVDSPFARTDSAAALSLDCRRDPRGGWMVAARTVNADRSLGRPIGEIKV